MITEKTILIFIFSILFKGFSCLNAQNAVSGNPEEYSDKMSSLPAEISPNMTHLESDFPYYFTFTGNPLVRHHGAADPDVHVWGDTVWMYCSQDHQGGYQKMDGYHAFSSPDLINWTDHGEILHSDNVEWGIEEGGWMWAPGAAHKNGKYYLYFPHKDKSGNWRIGVAVSERPEGPFNDSGAPLEGIGGIDPAIFIDDDGEAYIYNNNAIVAKLKPNMRELAEPPQKINYDRTNKIMDTYLQGFAEGSFMHKKNGVYYYSYTNWHNNVNQGFYAMGDNPYGPFEWKGPMAPKPQGAQDHHSIIEFKNKWYYFYHIAVQEYPEIKDGQSRIACFDRFFYNEDGTIKMVDHTRNVLKYPPSQKAFNNTEWQFPGDTVEAWQFDYFNQYDIFNKSYSDTLFAMDTAQTIGVYGCNDSAGTNIRSYIDIAQFKDAAQVKWDNIAQTFMKNGQWVEYSVRFNQNVPYLLHIRTRSEINANFNLIIYSNHGDTVYQDELNLQQDFKNLGRGNEETDWLRLNVPLTGLSGLKILRFDWHDNVGEPGIFGSFSFVKSELDFTPPEWYYISLGTFAPGTDIVVMTKEDATVFMVPQGTQPDTTTIWEASVSEVDATAYRQENLVTTHLNPGAYILYAIDGSGNISEASRVIRLEYPVNATQIAADSGAVVLYNSANQLIKVKSHKELVQLDVYNILGQKVGSRDLYGKPYEFYSGGLITGLYLVHLFSKDGTLTVKKIYKN